MRTQEYESDDRPLLEQGQPPTLRRVGASGALYLFLSYLAVGMYLSPMQTMFLHRACRHRGLDESHCKDKVDGVKVGEYDDAQRAAALAVSSWAVCSGLGQLAVCALYGALGDAHGRRVPLVSPLVGLLLTSLAVALTPESRQSDVLMALAFTFALLGGQYVTNHACFAALADVTQDAGRRERALVFAGIEAATWVGLVLGPILGGFAVKALGDQHSFFAVSAVGAVNAAVTFFTFPETLEKARRVPVGWHRANPVTSLRMFSVSRDMAAFSAVTLAGLISTSGGLAVLPLYLEKYSDADAVGIGWSISSALAAGCVGLCVLMPWLSRRMGLHVVMVLSLAGVSVSWLALCFFTRYWAVTAATAMQVMNPVFLPIVRTGVVNNFGKHRYGEALAAVGSLEQVTYLLAAPTMTAVYRATEDSVWEVVGGVGVHGLAFPAISGVGLVGAVAACFVSAVPDVKVAGDGEEEGSDEDAVTTLTCRSGSPTAAALLTPARSM